jgi:hypothetical protein
VLNGAGQAVALVSHGHATISTTDGKPVREEHRTPQPILTRNFPGWLLDSIA